jgi:hypothetical protein
MLSKLSTISKVIEPGRKILGTLLVHSIIVDSIPICDIFDAVTSTYIFLLKILHFAFFK